MKSGLLYTITRSEKSQIIITSLFIAKKLTRETTLTPLERPIQSKMDTKNNLGSKGGRRDIDFLSYWMRINTMN